MPLPVLELTWNFAVNQGPFGGGTLTDLHRDVLLAWKNTLKILGPAPWTVKGSSDSVTANLTGPSRGSLVAVAGNLLVDATDTFTLNDGTNPAKVFEFDSNATITPGNVAVSFTAGDSTETVRNSIVTAINGAALLNITAVRDHNDVTKVQLTNTVAGAIGNVAILETVANVGFTVSGMAGGSVGGSDLWINPTDLVSVNGASFNTAHSWIVLEAPSGAQLLLDWHTVSNSSGDNYKDIIMKWSPDGGFGGPETVVNTTTNIPTAANELVLQNSQRWLTNSVAAPITRMHVMVDNTGLNMRTFFNVANETTQRIIMANVVDALAGFTESRLFNTKVDAAGTEASSGPVYPTLLDAQTSFAIVTKQSGSVPMSFTTLGSANGAIGQRFTVPNEFDGEDPFLPIGVAASGVTGFNGRHGRIQDIWFGNAGEPTGTTFPISAGTRLFAQFGDIVVPWDGTIPLVA